MSKAHPALLAGEWRASAGSETFTATNPQDARSLGEAYPVSTWADCEVALRAADEAAAALRVMPDADERLASFLDAYAAAIEGRAEVLAAAASLETALPVAPRLKDVEIPRTAKQLRGAAATLREGSWRRPTIDSAINLRSCLGSVGPVLVIGPNNFPFAYNGISGGDFASAIAAGNPVIAKGHPLHPTTTRMLGELAHAAAVGAGLPAGTVQLLYHVSPEDGLRLVADGRLAAVGFTGSRAGGLKLKAAADAAGKPFFGEMSSVNPVVYLPGALAERGEEIAAEFVASALMATGQFCTSPGLNLLIAGADAEALIASVVRGESAAPPGTLLSGGGLRSLLGGIAALREAGAAVLAGGEAAGAGRCAVRNTVLRVSGARFLQAPEGLQTEAFGNASLFVVAEDLTVLKKVLSLLEGNLTGSIYSAKGGADDAAYAQVEPVLRHRVGRLLNDKMPTGVAVSPAMNHGGPYPATSNPHFSAVGFPGAVWRFTQLQCYDNVREGRLPKCLRDRNPSNMWRYINGELTRGDVSR